MRVVVPTSHWFDISMFRQNEVFVEITGCRKSDIVGDNPLFRQPIVPTTKYIELSEHRFVGITRLPILPTIVGITRRPILPTTVGITRRPVLPTKLDVPTIIVGRTRRVRKSLFASK